MVRLAERVAARPAYRSRAASIWEVSFILIQLLRGTIEKIRKAMRDGRMWGILSFGKSGQLDASCRAQPIRNAEIAENAEKCRIREMPCPVRFLTHSTHFSASLTVGFCAAIAEFRANSFLVAANGRL